MAAPTLTIVIATGGIEADGSTSHEGHMYYVLTDSNGNQTSYGFAPDRTHQGEPFAPGQVYPDDNTNYADLTISSNTVTISQQQYDTLTSFGTATNPDGSTNPNYLGGDLGVRSCFLPNAGE